MDLKRILIFVLLFNGCIADDFTLDFTKEHYSDLIDPTDPPEIICMVKRAQQIANIEWTPLDTIPNRVGVYPARVSIKGIPYSSVKELDKFVGQDVSFHTFMTAINNPYSVMYTERVNSLPYHGTNCGAYYGTVCNMAVNYALGIEIPYPTFIYGEIDCFQSVEPNNIQNLKEGDVLWSPGHVVLVLDIKYDQCKEISKVSILESSSETSIKTYSITSFLDRWQQVGWIAYRYKYLKNNIKYESIPFVSVEGERPIQYSYNNEICMSRGDRACYREDDDIIVNVLSAEYTTLKVYKDNKLYCTYELNGNNSVELCDLKYGMYKVRLVSNTNKSRFTSFEVLDTDVSIKREGDSCAVYFNSKNAVAECVKICTISGGQRELYVINENERSKGKLQIRLPIGDEFVKVYFRGQFGRVTNAPISSTEL